MASVGGAASSAIFRRRAAQARVTIDMSHATRSCTSDGRIASLPSAECAEVAYDHLWPTGVGTEQGRVAVGVQQVWLQPQGFFVARQGAGGVCGTLERHCVIEMHQRIIGTKTQTVFVKCHGRIAAAGFAAHEAEVQIGGGIGRIVLQNAL